MLVVVLALIASACWGVADFAGGLMSRRLSALVVLVGQQAVGAGIALVVVLAAAEEPPGTRALVLSVLAGAAGAIALGAFYRALAVGTMSLVAPISASGVTIPVAVGIATGDRPGPVQAVGLGLTLVGILLASREVHESDERGGAADERRAILLALFAAVGFGTFFLASDAAADDSILWLLVVGRSVAVALIAVAALAVGNLAMPPRRDVAVIALIGVLDLAATALYAVANTEGLLSVVAVVGALYPVATVLLARVVLRERLQPVQAAGVGLAFAGVAAVAGGG